MNKKSTVTRSNHKNDYKWLGIFFLGLLAWVLGNGLLSPLISVFIVKYLNIIEYTIAIHSFIATFFTIIFLHLIYKYFKKNLFHLFGLKKSILIKEFIIGFVVAIVFASIAVFIIIPYTDPNNKTMVETTKLVTEQPFINIFIAGLLLGGIAEEMFFRAHIITSISNIKKNNKYLLIFSVIIGAVLFGLGHRYQGTLGIIFTFITSFIYALLYIKRKSIISAMVAHGLYDVFTAIAIKYFLFT